MQLDQLQKDLDHLKDHPDDFLLAERICEDIGDELHHQRWDVIREFRARAAALRNSLAADSKIAPGTTSFLEGVLAALGEVCSAFEAAVRDRDYQYHAAGCLHLKNDYQDIIRLLAKGPYLPSELAIKMVKDRAHISRTLKALRAAGVVEKIQRSPLSDQRENPHRLTSAGLAMAEENLKNTQEEKLFSEQPVPVPAQIAPADDRGKRNKARQKVQKIS